MSVQHWTFSKNKHQKNNNRIATGSYRHKLPTIGFVAGGPRQLNSLTQAQRSSVLILYSCLAAIPWFISSQGGFVCFKHSRRFIVGILMSYIFKISVKIHSFPFTCLDATQVQNWILAHSRLPLQVSALSWAQPGRKDTLLKYVTTQPHAKSR